MATISGSVMLRPARVGLLVARPTLDDVQKAVEAATSSWGGIYFPIVDVPGFDDLDRRLERWSVDVLWPLTTDGAVSTLVDRPGFRWVGRSPYGPFDPPQDSLSTRVLDASWVLGSSGLKLVLPRWAESELATFSLSGSAASAKTSMAVPDAIALLRRFRVLLMPSWVGLI